MSILQLWLKPTNGLVNSNVRMKHMDSTKNMAWAKNIQWLMIFEVILELLHTIILLVSCSKKFHYDCAEGTTKERNISES